MDKQTDNLTFYISVLSGFLLTISEALPYVKVIQSNGIVELIHTALVTLAKRSTIPDLEAEPLLSQSHNNEEHTAKNNSHEIVPIHSDLIQDYKSLKNIAQINCKKNVMLCKKKTVR